jgi:hypothetical protein
MTRATEKTVECRVRNALTARHRPKQGVTQSLALNDWREVAITRFFSDYCVSSDAVPFTWMALRDLYSSPDASRCLREALHAAAFVSHANQLGLEWMALEAIGAYGRALASLSKALEDPEEVLSDTLLAAPYLIGQYEVRTVFGRSVFIAMTYAHQNRPSVAIYQQVF